MRYRFPRQARLTRTGDFHAVYRKGQRVNVPPLRFRAFRRRGAPGGEEEPGERSRLGMAIGRKVGKSVARNRWKRAIREAFRLHRHRLPAAYDLVAAVDWGRPAEDVGRVEEAFLAVVEILRQRSVGELDRPTPP